MSTQKDSSARVITPDEHQRVSKHFVNRLWNVFGEPNTNDLPSFVDEYIRSLSRFDTATLDKGCDRLFDTLKKEFRVSHWPTINDCRENCNWAAKEIHSANMQRQRPKDYSDEIQATAEARRVKEMVAGPIAERACREGWIVGLHDFVRDNRRLPVHAEESKLIADANYLLDCASGNVNMGNFHIAFLRMAEAMLARRADLINEFGDGGRA